MSDQTEIEVEICYSYDYELSNGLTKKIFHVYNQCFYDGKVTSNKHLKLAMQGIAKSRVFQWYYAKVGSQIVGIASYVYDPSKVGDLSVNTKMGENVCSVAVLPEFRRLGISRLIMNRIIEDYHHSKDLVVELKCDNPLFDPILKFYKSLEFEFLADDEDEEGNPAKNVYLIKRQAK